MEGKGKGEFSFPSYTFCIVWIFATLCMNVFYDKEAHFQFYSFGTSHLHCKMQGKNTWFWRFWSEKLVAKVYSRKCFSRVITSLPLPRLIGLINHDSLSSLARRQPISPSPPSIPGSPDELTEANLWYTILWLDNSMHWQPSLNCNLILMNLS